MSVRIQQLKLPVTHTEQELRDRIIRTLRIRPEELIRYEIVRRSLDARKEELRYVYLIDADVKREAAVLKKCRGSAEKAKRVRYRFPEPGTGRLSHRPVIVGTGPAGLFCGLMLARAGYAPVLLERGQRAEERVETVDRFWRLGILDPQSNVQFGEGGAGTFSDGKLNTLVKDPAGRNRKVLELFVEAGAPKEILYEQKPHLGTDLLVGIVRCMREEIVRLGGDIRFGCRMTDLVLESGAVRGIVTRSGGREPEVLKAEQVVLAIGHSARDTFAVLKERGVPMQPKAFAVGVRVEHPQEMINRSQYGEGYPRVLPPASYKVTRRLEDGRGVYSFCMCPGGYVVNASSEKGMLAVNGMSYQARDGRNANSAMIVTVTPADYGGTDVLAGVEFQRKLERAAYELGGGRIPVQTFGDFCADRASVRLGDISPCIKGAYELTSVRAIFPPELSRALEEGLRGCGRLIPGFAGPDAVLSGVESRTSSPVRILRNEELESGISGLYPCGEGAGYAGGITSAAMDGLKIAEAIAKKYAPCYDITNSV
ncbi:MAG: FAD-dependent oxidoreductase [Lachnospiraceae bacterium]|nr:FAD-dependent oxidoreductase [Lachnospiraceae bacterium]